MADEYSEEIEFEYGGQVRSIFVKPGTSEAQIGKAVDEYIVELENMSGSDVPETPTGEPASYQTPAPSLWQDIKRDVPRMIGGLTLPIAAAPKLAQMTPKAAMATSAALAGTGGAIGEAGQTAYESITGSPYAPETAGEAAGRVGGAFAQEAVGDIAGNLVLQQLTKLGKFNPLSPIIDPYTRELQNMLSRGGGVLTRRQLDPDNQFLATIDNIASKSMFGSKYYDDAMHNNEVALDILSDHMARDFFGGVDAVTDKELGQLFSDTIKQGVVAHEVTASKLYGFLDKKVAEREVTTITQQQVPTGLVDPSGQPIMNPVDVATKSMVDNAPVNIAKTKQLLLAEARKLKISSDVRDRIVTTITNADDKLLFKSANDLRSELLSIIRSKDKTLETDAAKGFAKYVEGALTKDIEESAKKHGVYTAWKNARNFYERGQEVFRNQTMKKLLKAGETNLARIGDQLFAKGNQDEILRARAAIQYAAKQDKNIDFDKVWNSMKAGYFRGLLHSTREAPEGAFNVGNMWRVLNDRKSKRTLETVFSPTEMEGLRRFYELTKRISGKKTGSLGTAIQFAQAGAAADLAFLKIVDPLTSGTILIAPAVLAKMLTSPENIKLLNTGMLVPQTSKLGRATAMKLINEIAALSIERTATIPEEQQ